MDVLPDTDLVSLEAGARIMGIGKSTAYLLARKGEMPGAVKVGGRWRFSLVKYRRAMHGEEPTPSVSEMVEALSFDPRHR